MIRGTLLLGLAASLLSCGCHLATHLTTVTLKAEQVTVSESENRFTIETGGQPFATLRLDLQRPCIHPLAGPGGVSVLRNYPVAKATPGESADHPHHTGLWFAHGSVAGEDFWHGKETTQKPHHWSATTSEGGVTVEGSIDWLKSGGEKTLTEKRTLRFSSDDQARTIDFTSELTSATGEAVTFGDTKEGTFAIRMAPELRLEGKVAAGSAFNSEGVEGKAIWGKRARWVCYSGTVGDEKISVAIFDHPSNLRHPTWWHARAYGLCAANPFGIHDFENKPAGSGDFELAAGDRLRLDYRVLLLEGNADSKKIDRLWQEWSAVK